MVGCSPLAAMRLAITPSSHPNCFVGFPRCGALAAAAKTNSGPNDTASGGELPSWGGELPSAIRAAVTLGRWPVTYDKSIFAMTAGGLHSDLLAPQRQHAIDHDAGLAKVIGRIAEPFEHGPVEVRRHLRVLGENVHQGPAGRRRIATHRIDKVVGYDVRRAARVPS